MELAVKVLEHERSPYGMFLREVAQQELRRIPNQIKSPMKEARKGYLRGTQASRGKKANAVPKANTPAATMSSKKALPGAKLSPAKTDRFSFHTNNDNRGWHTEPSAAPKQKRTASLTHTFRQGVSTVKKKVRFDLSNLQELGSRFGGR